VATAGKCAAIWPEVVAATNATELIAHCRVLWLLLLLLLLFIVLLV
jgi:hypothetical protein